MRRNSPILTAFTLVELLVVIGIIGVLFAMLLSTLARAQAAANMAACKSNLQQIGNASRLYANDYHDRYPDSWTIGMCVYRRGYLETNPNDPFSIPETYGLPALYSINHCITNNKVWICPAAMDRFQDYKNTYVWALLSATPTTSIPRPPGTWGSRERGDNKGSNGHNADVFWVFENTVNMPPATGINYSGAAQPIDPTLKSQMLPHPYRTKITYDTRRGAMNVLFMDGSVGVAVYGPFQTTLLRE